MAHDPEKEHFLDECSMIRQKELNREFPLLFWLGKNYLLISISMWYEFRDGFTNRARAEKYRQLRYFIVLTWFWPSEPAVQKKHPLRFFSFSKFSLLMFWLKTVEHPASTIPRRWYKNIRFLFHTVSLAWKRSNFFISPCKLVLRLITRGYYFRSTSFSSYARRNMFGPLIFSPKFYYSPIYSLRKRLF